MIRGKISTVLVIILFGTGVPAFGAAYTYYGAHLTDQSPWINRISVYNNGEQSADFILTIHGSGGQTLFQGMYTVPANFARKLVMTAFAGYTLEDGEDSLLPMEGTFTIETDSPKLRPKVSYKYGDSPSLCEFFLSGSLALEHVLPNTIHDHFSWSGLAVMNPRNTPVTVVMNAYGAGQLLAGAEVSLGPFSKYVRLSDGIWPGIEYMDFDQVCIFSQGRPLPPPMSITGNDSQDRHLFFNGVPTEPGDGKIAYCYQPLTGGIHQIYTIDRDGSGNIRLVETNIGLNHHDWSPDGQRLAAVGYIDNNTWSIYTFNADGTGLTRITTRTGVYDNEPSWSPDGEQISFSRVIPSENYRSELWIMDTNGSNAHPLGPSGFAARWAPDGSRLVYQSSMNEPSDILTCARDGSDIRRITDTPVTEINPVFSPDGTRIAYVTNVDGNHEIYVMNADGTDPVRLTQTEDNEYSPRWSPGGAWIVFNSGPFQEWEVYVMRSDGSGYRPLTDSPPGITAINPVWRPAR